MASTKVSDDAVFDEVPLQPSRVPKSKSIHWHIPAMMIGAIGAGVIFAICHHVFYQSLDGQPVSNGNLRHFPISKQQSNIAIGEIS